MTRNLLFLTFLLAALAVTTTAQALRYQKTDFLDSVDETARTRRVDRSAGVNPSIVINTTAAERAAFEMLNRKREENGLRPLAWCNDLATIARQHSRNMADLKFFGHRGEDNKMVSDRADDIGLKKWRAIGENIAFNRGYQDPIERAVELWLDSPSHRRNLMNGDWRESAVGVAVTSDGSYYFTQVFMKR